MPLLLIRQKILCTALGKVLLAGLWNWSFPSTQYCEAIPGVLYTVLGPQVEEWHGHAGGGPLESCKDNEGTEAGDSLL